MRRGVVLTIATVALIVGVVIGSLAGPVVAQQFTDSGYQQVMVRQESDTSPLRVQLGYDVDICTVISNPNTFPIAAGPDGCMMTLHLPAELLPR